VAGSSGVVWSTVMLSLWQSVGDEWCVDRYRRVRPRCHWSTTGSWQVLWHHGPSTRPSPRQQSLATAQWSIPACTHPQHARWSTNTHTHIHNTPTSPSRAIPTARHTLPQMERNWGRNGNKEKKRIWKGNWEKRKTNVRSRKTTLLWRKREFSGPMCQPQSANQGQIWPVRAHSWSLLTTKFHLEWFILSR